MSMKTTDLFSTMAPTIASALSDFVAALTATFFSLLNSVLAFGQAIVVLAKDLLATILQIGQSLVALVLGLFQGVVGFVAGKQYDFVGEKCG